MLIHILRGLLFLTKQGNGWGIVLSEGSLFPSLVYLHSLYPTLYWGNIGWYSCTINCLSFCVTEKFDRIISVIKERIPSTRLNRLPVRVCLRFIQEHILGRFA